MPDLTKVELEEATKRFDELGPSHVEMLINTGGLPLQLHNPAMKWLAAKKDDAAAKGTNK